MASSSDEGSRRRRSVLSLISPAGELRPSCAVDDGVDYKSQNDGGSHHSDDDEQHLHPLVFPHFLLLHLAGLLLKDSALRTLKQTEKLLPELTSDSSSFCQPNAKDPGTDYQTKPASGNLLQAPPPPLWEAVTL